MAPGTSNPYHKQCHHSHRDLSIRSLSHRNLSISSPS